MPLFSILSSRTVNCTRIGNKANMGEFLIYDDFANRDKIFLF